ncbi:hypothetical protein GZL_02510 [Streptomyces sp. 769]|nr:hypothetical protein GZL_02510 [Streptomyces sp. 769]
MIHPSFRIFDHLRNGRSPAPVASTAVRRVSTPNAGRSNRHRLAPAIRALADILTRYLDALSRHFTLR